MAAVVSAWLLAQQPWIVPIPGTRRRSRLEENECSTAVALSADELADLNAVADRIGVAGDRYNESQMGFVGADVEHRLSDHPPHALTLQPVGRSGANRWRLTVRA